MLALAGLTSGATGTGTGRPAGATADAVAGQGPVLDLRDGRVASAAPPRRTVVLTFDDGPDPEWTPAILEVLRRHDVPATFFVVGEAVTAHPELVRAELADGHEVGAHTYGHVDLGSVPGWRRELELSLTQLALAAATGRHTNLFRPPYSSTPSEVDDEDLGVLRSVSEHGYLVVLADLDSRDWERGGVDRIVEAATPAGHQGAIILMHDGGGDRSQTVAALDLLVDRLQRRGDRFATVSELLDLPTAGVDVPVGSRGRWQAEVAVAAIRISRAVTRALGWALVPLGLLAVGRTLVVLVLARRHRRRVRGEGEAARSPVSVVVPAYNEEAGIEATVRSLLASAHPDVEVVVVDDGSTDATAAIVGRFEADGVRLLRQANGGKARALAAGIGAARHDVVVIADGDTVFEPRTIPRLLAPFADDRVGAVSGNTKVANRRGLLGRWQHVEYVMGFNLDRRMYEELECMPTVPGAVGAFRRSALLEVGGPSDDTLAEDTDLTMAVNRAGWRVVYAEDAVAWTEAPADLSGLWRQRYRWCYGTLQAIWKHRAAVRDRRSPLGRRGLPYLLAFQVVLPVLAPIIDVFALYGLVFLDPAPVLAYWIGFNLLQLATADYALRLDGESRRVLWVVPLQQFVYRQVMYLVVVQSLVTAVAGVALPWQRVDRRGAAGAALERAGSR